MKKITTLIFITLIAVMLTSCSKEDLTTFEDNTSTNITEDISKSRAKSGISITDISTVCDKLGPRLEVELLYIGNWTFNVTVYIDLFEADGETLIETYVVNNYNEQTYLNYTVGNGFNHKCCSLLDPGTDYLIGIRYSNTTSNLIPTSTEPDCFCTLGGIIG